MLKAGFANCKFAICAVSHLIYFRERDFDTHTMSVFAACKFLTCMFSPPNMIKVHYKCTWMSTLKCLHILYTVEKKHIIIISLKLHLRITDEMALPTQTTPSWIGPKYFYQTGHVSIKIYGENQTLLKCIMLPVWLCIMVYWHAYFLKTSFFINFILAHEEILSWNI